MRETFLTLLSVTLLVGLFDGVEREFRRRGEISRREDFIRRGYVLWVRTVKEVSWISNISFWSDKLFEAPCLAGVLLYIISTYTKGQTHVFSKRTRPETD